MSGNLFEIVTISIPSPKLLVGVPPSPVTFGKHLGTSELRSKLMAYDQCGGGLHLQPQEGRDIKGLSKGEPIEIACTGECAFVSTLDEKTWRDALLKWHEIVFASFLFELRFQDGMGPPKKEGSWYSYLDEIDLHSPQRISAEKGLITQVEEELDSIPGWWKLWKSFYDAEVPLYEDYGIAVVCVSGSESIKGLQCLSAIGAAVMKGMDKRFQEYKLDSQKALAGSLSAF